MYYHGRGLKQDDAQAVKWFRLAADQGDAARPVQSRCHARRRSGRSAGLRRGDQMVSARRRAGRSPRAVQSRCLLCRGAGRRARIMSPPTCGSILPRRASCRREADRRRAAINNRDLTASRMSREQIAEAQRLSREWRPKVAEGNAPNADRRSPSGRRGPVTASAALIAALNAHHAGDQCESHLKRRHRRGGPLRCLNSRIFARRG